MAYRRLLTAAFLAGVVALMMVGCASEAPQPLAPKNISAPLQPPARYLPPGLATSLKDDDVVSLTAPAALRLTPKIKGQLAGKLPPGSLLRLKSRVLNAEGPWWLVDAGPLSGWIAEPQLLRK